MPEYPLHQMLPELREALYQMLMRAVEIERQRRAWKFYGTKVKVVQAPATWKEVV